MPFPSGGATPLDGAALPWPWALPFLGMLATIAIAPLSIPKIWQRHYVLFATFWSVLTLGAIGLLANPLTAIDAFLHAMLADYVSFIVLLFALFTVAGGILVSGDLPGTPRANTLMLGIGTAIASFVGTTGAAMILIRPLIRANDKREHNAHVIVFFIFLAANIGGALTPFGNPPLFVGFLNGVSFFWTMRNLWLETVLVTGLVLAIFFLVDLRLFRADGGSQASLKRVAIRIHGIVNLILIATIIGAIALSAVWHPGISFVIRGARLELQNAVRDLALVIIALASLLLTPDEHREANGFSWEPIREVAILFAAIFICIIPVLAMLQAGVHGSFAWLFHLATGSNGGPDDPVYFWLTGALSAFLDNAPTYLVFFKLAGGDPHALMGPLHGTLAAISMGAVYMGALTYIGNAPNFMIYAIATEHGIRMPSFFGYLIWSSIVLIPVFVVLTLVFFIQH